MVDVEKLKEMNIDICYTVINLINDCVSRVDYSKLEQDTKITVELNNIIIYHKDRSIDKYDMEDFLDIIVEEFGVVNITKIKKYYKVNSQTLKIISPHELSNYKNRLCLTDENIKQLSKLNIRLILFKTGFYYQILGITQGKYYILTYGDDHYTVMDYIKYMYKLTYIDEYCNISIYDKSFNPNEFDNLGIFNYLYELEDRFLITYYNDIIEDYEEIYFL